MNYLLHGRLRTSLSNVWHRFLATLSHGSDYDRCLIRGNQRR